MWTRFLYPTWFVSLEVQYIDGTKIEANANRYTFVWKKATKTNRDKLDKKVKAVLSEAERQLNMELGEEKEEVMSSSEMAERSERNLPEASCRCRGAATVWHNNEGD